MMLVLVASLVLQVHVETGDDLRMAALDIGSDEVEWTVDGVPRGTTPGGEAIVVHVSPGDHVIVAATDHQGPWRIVARAVPSSPSTVVSYAGSESARHGPTAAYVIPDVGVAVLAVVLGLAGARRRCASKGP